MNVSRHATISNQLKRAIPDVPGTMLSGQGVAHRFDVAHWELLPHYCFQPGEEPVVAAAFIPGDPICDPGAGARGGIEIPAELRGWIAAP